MSIVYSLVAVVAFVQSAWVVEPAGTSANGLAWWRVSQNGRAFAEYSCPVYAREVAAELTARKIGRQWPRDLSGLFDDVNRAAFARVPAVPLDEQKRWWAERSKLNK